jgi:hypothetical protein
MVLGLNEFPLLPGAVESKCTWQVHVAIKLLKKKKNI